VKSVYANKSCTVLNMDRSIFPATDKSLIRQAMLLLPVPMIMVNQDNLICYVNQQAELLMAQSQVNMLGKQWFDIVSLCDQAGQSIMLPPMAMKQSTRLPDNRGWWMLGSETGKQIPVQLSVASIDDPAAQKHYGFAVVFYEMSDIQQLVERLLHQCSHDYLTGLVNRSVFESRLARAVDNSATGMSSHALMFLDMDNFKTINDSYGHKAGDALLQNIARVFRSIIRDRDTLARFGGDEFALLLEHCNLAHAMETANLLRMALQESPLYWHGETIKSDVSIGMVMIGHTSPSPDTLLLQADAACYMAKKQIWKHIHVYRQGDAASVFTSGKVSQEGLHPLSFDFVGEDNAKRDTNTKKNA